MCPSCGNLRSLCSDPMGLWYPQRTVCWASATREVVQRKWSGLHQNAKPDPRGYLPTDGTTVWVSPHNLTPDDNFLTPTAQAPEPVQ